MITRRIEHLFKCDRDCGRTDPIVASGTDDAVAHARTHGWLVLMGKQELQGCFLVGPGVVDQHVTSYTTICPDCMKRDERPQNHDEIEAFLDIFYEAHNNNTVGLVRDTWDRRRYEMREA
jgi:hypothetical protein